MTIEGAVIKEQGVTFGVVIVKSHALQNHGAADDLIVAYQGVLGVAPVVLMAQDSRGTPTYYGRQDIVAFMAKLHISQIPWKRYTIT